MEKKGIPYHGLVTRKMTVESSFILSTSLGSILTSEMNPPPDGYAPDATFSRPSQV